MYSIDNISSNGSRPWWPSPSRPAPGARSRARARPCRRCSRPTPKNIYIYMHISLSIYLSLTIYIYIYIYICVYIYIYTWYSNSINNSSSNSDDNTTNSNNNVFKNAAAGPPPGGGVRSGRPREGIESGGFLHLTHAAPRARLKSLRPVGGGQILTPTRLWPFCAANIWLATTSVRLGQWKRD